MTPPWLEYLTPKVINFDQENGRIYFPKATFSGGIPWRF
jgi:hypothetical protein